jgi:hypothetical protein
MMLAEYYLAKHETPFTAYMALQRDLLYQYLMQGGTPEEWCRSMAPVFRRRYGPVFRDLDTLEV